MGLSVCPMPNHPTTILLPSALTNTQPHTNTPATSLLFTHYQYTTNTNRFEHVRAGSVARILIRIAGRDKTPTHTYYAPGTGNGGVQPKHTDDTISVCIYANIHDLYMNMECMTTHILLYNLYHYATTYNHKINGKPLCY